jgi:hypothetical protein
VLWCRAKNRLSIEDIAIESFLLKNKAMFFAMQFPQTRDYFSVL